MSYHVITTVSIKKSKKMKQTKSQTQSHLVISQVFVLYFIFASISSILFNSLLQLLLTDRNPQTFHPLSVLFLILDVDQLFHYRRRILFRCFVSSIPASLKSLSMPANDTGTLKIIFAQIFSLPSLLNFQKPVGSLIGIRLSRNSLKLTFHQN